MRGGRCATPSPFPPPRHHPRISYLRHPALIPRHTRAPLPSYPRLPRSPPLARTGVSRREQHQRFALPPPVIPALFSSVISAPFPRHSRPRAGIGPAPAPVPLAHSRQAALACLAPAQAEPQGTNARRPAFSSHPPPPRPEPRTETRPQSVSAAVISGSTTQVSIQSTISSVRYRPGSKSSP